MTNDEAKIKRTGSYFYINLQFTHLTLESNQSIIQSTNKKKMNNVKFKSTQ